MNKKPVMLMILDGFGISDKVEGNAVKAASKPNFDKYYKNYPHTELGASGLSVGLPDGQMGNSEVGQFKYRCRKNSISGSYKDNKINTRWRLF